MMGTFEVSTSKVVSGLVGKTKRVRNTKTNVVMDVPADKRLIDEEEVDDDTPLTVLTGPAKLPAVIRKSSPSPKRISQEYINNGAVLDEEQSSNKLVKIVDDASNDANGKLLKALQELMIVKNLQWTGSADKSFETWLVSNDEKAPLPTGTNCWGVILTAACNAGLITKEQARKANTQTNVYDALIRKDKDLDDKNTSNNVTLEQNDQELALGPNLAFDMIKSTTNHHLLLTREQVATSGKAFPEAYRHALKQIIDSGKIAIGNIIVFGKGEHVCLYAGNENIIQLDVNKEVVGKDLTPQESKDSATKARLLDQKSSQLKRKLGLIKEAEKRQEIESQILQINREAGELRGKIKGMSVKKKSNEVHEQNLFISKYFDLGDVHKYGIHWGELPYTNS